MRDEPRFTPGPWATDFDRPDFELDHPGQHPTVFSRGKHIASVGNMEEWTDALDEWQANARLIAASPSLFEALKEKVSDYDDISDDELPNFCGPTTVAWVRKARAALSQAQKE